MSHSRSQISLRLLKTLEDIEVQDAEGNKTVSYKSETLKDEEEEPNDIVRNYSSHLASSSSQKFKDHYRDSTGKRASLRSISFKRTHADEKETSNTDFKNGILVKDEQSENSLELPDYNFENYDDGLSIVTQQLKSIQETQDVILAELRMDIEQLNADNLALRLSNENLAKQVENLKRIINDLTKSKNNVQQENTDDDIEIVDGNARSAKSSHLVILNSDTDISPTPPQQDREHGMERNSSHETSHHIPRSASEISSRRRKSGKSRKKRKTHSKDRKKESKPRDHHHHRANHTSRNKNRNDSKTNLSSLSKNKSKRRCFEFMRRRKRKFELNNNNNNDSNEIENDSYLQQEVQ